MNKVRLNPAYSFICPECQGQNFIAAEPVEMTTELADEYADGDCGTKYELLKRTWYYTPTSVECGNCGQQADVERQQPEDDEEY